MNPTGLTHILCATKLTQPQKNSNKTIVCTAILPFHILALTKKTSQTIPDVSQVHHLQGLVNIKVAFL